MIPIKKLEPFRNFCLSIGELPSAFVDSMTYVELLTWLCNYLEKTVIPTVNNNGEAVEELQGLFVELKDYVDTYLDSPEFLEDVNTKLDEMATDGTFDQIINTNITGSLSNLDTTSKTNLVSAINEVNGKVGTLANLTTTAKTDSVSAINEVNGKVGTLTSLTTTSKTDTVSAINEVNSSVSVTDTKVGSLSSLQTTVKTSVVNAINEVNGKVLNCLPLSDIAVVSEVWADSSATPKSIDYPTGFNRDNCVVVSTMWEDTDSVTQEYTLRRALAGDGIQVSLKASEISVLNTYAGGTVYVVLMQVDFGLG